MEITEGVSVKVIRLNKLSPEIVSESLGTRREGALGIVTVAFVPGFGSDAFRIDHREDFGEKNGEWGIYFPGELAPIPDLLPQ